MSYCVNCGVELSPAEQQCPLCQVPVMNPAAPWQEPKEQPYPHRTEYVERRVDRQFFSLLVSLILLIPIFICLINDLFTNGRVTWSVYVIGALFVVFVIFLLPYLLGKCNPLWFLFFDVLATLAFLYLIDYKAESAAWFWKLALPVTVFLGIFIALFILWFKKPRPILQSMGMFCLAAGLYAMCVEMIVNFYRSFPLFPHWSWYSLGPCVLIALLLLLVNRRRGWREGIYKRMFF